MGKIFYCLWLIAMGVLLFSGNINAALTDLGNGIVADGAAGLMWQQGEPGYMTWNSAVSYCEGLSIADKTEWRLPDITELESLTDNTVYAPAIDINYFPDAYASNYWAYTTFVNLPDRAWSVDVYNGNTDNYGMSYEFYVRCVHIAEIVYYCDDDSDGHISLAVSGTCTGSGCVPAGCQTMAGDDCNGVNADSYPGAAEVCDFVDNNCNGQTDEGLDTDEDTVADCSDNCSETYNPLQQDTDTDGYGNICDADLNNDATVGFQDYNLFKAAWLSNSSKINWNPDADFNSDGIVGFQDFNILKVRWLTSAPWK